MALRFIDSFDHYAIGEMFLKWSAAVSGTGSISAGNGRWGTSCYRCASGSQNQGVRKVLDAQPTWIVGAAFKIGTGAAQNYFYRLLDGATVHVELRWDTGGHVFITRAGTTLATGTTILSVGVWYYIELLCTIGDVNPAVPQGAYEVRINGATELVSTNADTRNAGNSSADRIDVGTISGTNSQLDIDDVYICDGTGSSPSNTFLGDVRVEALYPNGNGNSSVLVGSDTNSTDNYLLVDESTTTGATTDYVESSTVGDKDTYAYTNPSSASGTVYGVQILPYAAKTDAGVRSIVSVARLSTTEVDSSAKTLSATATYYPDIRETKPGGGAWSISDVSNAEFGVKINA
jgi:hypothetical protein